MTTLFCRLQHSYCSRHLYLQPTRCKADDFIRFLFFSLYFRESEFAATRQIARDIMIDVRASANGTRDLHDIGRIK